MTTILTRPAAVLATDTARIKTLLKAVLPHTAEDDPEDPPIPALTQLHIEIRNGDLRLICSDRFSMGIVRQSMTSTSFGFNAMFAVNAEDVRVALFSLKAGEANLIVEQDAIRITTADGDLKFPGEGSILPWRGVLDKSLKAKGTPTERVALNPMLLARFEAARPLAAGHTMLFHLGGEHGAIVATASGRYSGTSFLGMVMPIHQESAAKAGYLPERPLDAWLDLLDEDPIEVVMGQD